MNAKSISLALIAIVLCVPAWAQDAPKSDAVKEEMQKFQGTWQVAKSVTPDGTAETDEQNKDIALEFKGDRMIFHKKTGDKKTSDQKTPHTYSLDVSKQPKWLDTDADKGADKLAAGIYKLEGDELTICIGPAVCDGKHVPRPTEFKPNKDNGQGLLVLKRVKNP